MPRSFDDRVSANLRSLSRQTTGNSSSLPVFGNIKLPCNRFTVPLHGGVRNDDAGDGFEGELLAKRVFTVSRPPVQKPRFRSKNAEKVQLVSRHPDLISPFAGEGANPGAVRRRGTRKIPRRRPGRCRGSTRGIRSRPFPPKREGRSGVRAEHRAILRRRRTAKRG